MNTVLLALVLNSQLWFAVPLIVAISIAYAASRHEQVKPIMVHAARTAFWIVLFMSVIYVVVLLISQSQ